MAKKEGAAYWIGLDTGELDLVRFDGNVAYGMMRRHEQSLGTSRMRAELVEMGFNPTTITGAIFKGRYYASYESLSGSTLDGITHDKTLRYDLNTHTLDRQPWGCDVFRMYEASGIGYFTCVHPGDGAGGYVSKLFSVLGTQLDNAGNISRVLIPRAFTFGIDIVTHWLYINVRGVNGETVTAPTVSYSVDGLPFTNAGKSWATTTSGTTWRTTAGEYVQQRIIQAGTRANVLHVKITHSDAKDWGIREIEVVGVPMRQQHQLGA